MADMHGAFDPRFPVPDSGVDTLLVGGPLKWDGDDPGRTMPAKAITIESVRVIQDGNEAGAAPGTEWTRPDDDDTREHDHWPAELSVGLGPFTADRATGLVKARVTLMDDTVTDEEWLHEFELVIGTPFDNP
jgi:hypothetical protein